MCVIMLICSLNMMISRHVHRDRPESLLAAGGALARGLPPRRQSQEPHPRQPLLLISQKAIDQDLKVRPIHHRLEGRVRSHIFLCMLAYYVEWHMREAWRPLMFTDQVQQAK